MPWRSENKIIISLLFLVFTALFLVFNAYQNSLASFAWAKFRSPNIATLLDKSDANLAMQIGSYYFGGGDYNLKKSERAYKKAVSIDPKILWGHYQLARIYFVGGAYDKALEEIGRELEANPENLRSLYMRGLVYGYRGRVGDLENSEKDFRRFTEWAPKEWAGYNDLAWILSKQGKNLEAEKAIDLAFKKARGAETNPWLWNSLGVAELNLKKYEKAILSFEKARNFAENLSLEKWHDAYPGNKFTDATEGIKVFKDAISENLRRSQSGLSVVDKLQ